jgi:glycosyltransferase involved in cell wall biosynthesis
VPIRRVVILSHTYIDPDNRGKLRALAARGLEVTAAVPQQWRTSPMGATWDLKWERQGGLEIFPIPVRAVTGRPAETHFNRRALASLLRDKRPDLLQIEEEPYAVPTRQAVRMARRLSIPCVAFTWDGFPHRLPWMSRWRRSRLLRKGRLAGAVAGNEQAAGRARESAGDLPLEIIPQLGVQVPASLERDSHEGLSVGFFGRLVPSKGVDILLEALARNRSSRWTLTIAGEGPDRERLEALASRHRLAARVRWLGAVLQGQRRALWPGLDLVIQPSRTTKSWAEPFGHMLVEGMAHGAIAIASSSGALPEVVGDAGCVFTEGTGAVDELARLLDWLGTDASERARLSQAGRARVLQLFSEDAVAERTLNFWGTLVS